ncbi:sensor histidine kinase [Desulfothermus sp.]
MNLRWNTSTSILLLAISTLFLISLEEISRNYYFSLQEKIFFLGTCFGWMALIFLIYHQGITIDKVPIFISHLLISFILLCTLSSYFLLKKGAFFNINFHPSPIVVIRFTFTIAFLIGLMIIIGVDIFTQLYFPLKMPYIEILLFLIFFILVCIFILPSKFLKGLKQRIYHHFYLPAQDYALEVKFFLSVINKHNWQKEFILHIYEKLPVSFVGLYVHKGHQYILETKFPLNAAMPEILKNIPINAIPLQAETNVMGYLYINPIKKFTMEQKELIQFWSSTMGFLIHYFQEKEKQEQRQKLMIFSQATAFILHDAKNLAQLLNLLEKNYQKAKAQDDVQSFVEELLAPSLEQAKIRAERIIKRLNIFHPLKLHLETIDLVFFLKESVHKLQHVIPRVNISFFTSLKKANIKIDPDLLYQILENLFFNAYQAGATKIIVKLTSQDNGYLLKVEDNGSGIKLKDRKKLFTPFFTTKPKGTGLGLYQAKVLLERVGNTIWYEPNRDKGSIFYVWFKK